MDPAKGEVDGGTLTQPAAALSSAQFRELCREAPIQARAPRPAHLSFVPLSEAEGPRPGLLLGLDAEFVALSQPAARLGGYTSDPGA